MNTTKWFANRGQILQLVIALVACVFGAIKAWPEMKANEFFSGGAILFYFLVFLVVVLVVNVRTNHNATATTTAAATMFASESAIVALTHRRTQARKQSYERAFSEGDDILYVTIMSEHTVKLTGGVPDFLKALKPNAKIRVLTWYSNDKAIEAFHKNLGENDDPRKTIAQVDEALNQWRKLRRDFPKLNFNVKVYESSPTMQGTLVRGRWALIEPLPYHVGTDNRPGIILTQADAPQTLEQLWNAFDELYERGAKDLTADWPPAANSLSAAG